MNDDKPLLLRFFSDGGHLAAKRSTLKECAALMGVTETRAAHIAINQLWLSLTNQDSTNYDFPKMRSDWKPTAMEKALTKKGLNDFFTKASPVESTPKMKSIRSKKAPHA